jgi:PDZ domain
MKPLVRALLFLAVAVCGGVVTWAADPRAWDRSYVTLEVTYKDYDYTQPWSKPTRTVRKGALVLPGQEVLTTAQHLPGATLVRLQRGGRGKWVNATVKWMDPHANLALITTDVASFWDGLKPAELAAVVPPGPDFNLLRWRDGNLESRRVEFSKFSVREGGLSFAPRLILEVSSELPGLGWAEALTVNGEAVGLTASKSGNTCQVIPSSFIRRVLEAQKSGNYRGLGYFDFTWQPAENPATLEFLKLTGTERGAVVTEVLKRAGTEPLLKPRDLLLEVDGFPVDVEGDYEDPDYGHLMLENLSTRSHFAGETVPLKIWRDGKEQTVQYTLPAATYADELVPQQSFGREPEYVVAGGLVFQPLEQAFLRAWGDDWRRRAPYRLQYYQNEHPTPERPSLVMLSTVLPDPVNVGYQETRFLVVDKVNGRKISTLSDLNAAFKEPHDGVQRIEFMPGDSLQRILLDAKSMDAATQRVVERYGIPSAQSLGEK